MAAADAVPQYLVEVAALASSLFCYYFLAAVVTVAGAEAEIMTDAAEWIPAGLLLSFCCSVALETIAAILTTVVDVAANSQLHTGYRLFRELPFGSSPF